MTNKTLRSLAKDYANGVLDRESYRKARDELLQGILAGKILVVKNEYRAPLKVDDLDITRDKTAIMPAAATPKRKEPRPTTEFVPPEPPPPPVPAPASSSPLKLILITSVIAAICVIIIVAVFTKPDSEEQSQISPPDSTSQEEVSSVEDSNAGKKLIEEFLHQNNWTDSSLQQFITEWKNLDLSDQYETLSLPIKTQLANAINRQLLEERALFNIDGDRASVIARQQALVNFANDVGINDPRIMVQEFDESLIAADEKDTAVVTEDVTPAALDEAQPPVTGMDETTAEVTPAEEIAVQANETAATDDNETTNETIVAETPAADVAKTDIPVATKEEVQPPEETKQQITNKTEQTTSSTSSTTTNKNACHAALAKQRQPYCRDTINGTSGKGPTLVVIQGGKFMMGGEKPHELPSHEVVIPKPFAIAVNEITHGEFEQFCGDTQKQCAQQPWSNKEYPVVNITWNDAVAYTDWLSNKTGNKYRLPTEAEWEYAARARTKTKYPFGDEILITDAVFSAIKPLTSPLPRSDRSINRNKFRLYHMAGNVREWVLDTWSDNYNNAPADGSAHTNPTSDSRVVRGGSYADNDDALRSGARTSLRADSSDVYTGFRVVQVLSE